MIWNFLQAAIVKALGQEAREKHKFDIARKYAKGKLTDFRSEERRKVRYDKIVTIFRLLRYFKWQVLGQDPHAKYCLLDMRNLATEIMRQMGQCYSASLVEK